MLPMTGLFYIYLFWQIEKNITMSFFSDLFDVDGQCNILRGDQTKIWFSLSLAFESYSYVAKETASIQKTFRFRLDCKEPWRGTIVKFVYYEKATKFWKIFTLLLTVCTVVKNNMKIFQNFVAFSEYMNLRKISETHE